MLKKVCPYCGETLVIDKEIFETWNCPECHRVFIIGGLELFEV